MPSFRVETNVLSNENDSKNEQRKMLVKDTSDDV